MHPIRSVSRIFRQFADIRPSRRLFGPAVACIGWIPFFAPGSAPSCGAISYGEKKKKFWSRQSAIDKMFSSGNPKPDQPFGSRDRFVEVLATKEFRGALVLDEVSALADADGRFIGVEFQHLGAIGYTPLRSAPGSIVYFCSGYGDGDYRLESLPDQYVTIDIWRSFKMGKLVDLGSYLYSGTRATSAAVRLRYTFWKDGRIEISVAGSAVPTLDCEIGWTSPHSIYDMLQASDAEIKDFFEAGRCATAPVRHFQTIQAPGRWGPA